jgi:hypothetical protein
MSRIVKLSVDSIQRLRAVDITPERHMNRIGGKNGQGKTSLLDSIAMVVGGANEFSDVPVRRGAKKASVRIQLDDGLVLRRTFTAEGTTQLTIENAEGARYPKPQDMLDRLTGKLTFDPLEFKEMGKTPDGRRQQLEKLKKMVGLDFSAQDAQRKKLYDDRAVVNAQAKTAAAKIEFMPQHADAPAEEQSVTAIVQERDTAKEHNAGKMALERGVREASETFEDAKLGRKQVADEIEQLEARLKSFREQLAEYDEKLPAICQRVAAANVALGAFNPIDLSPINLRLANAESVNVKVRQNRARADAVREAEEIAAKADVLTSQIEIIDKGKVDTLAATKFPVPGLSFNENGVLFNELPFDQASDAEKLRVSVAIGIALNPTLKVLLVRNGSLLDDESLALLTELAIEADAQVWLECVSTDATKMTLIIENGEVKAKEEVTA